MKKTGTEGQESIVWEVDHENHRLNQAALYSSTKNPLSGSINERDDTATLIEIGISSKKGGGDMGKYKIVFLAKCLGEEYESSIELKAENNDAIIECSKVVEREGCKVIRIEVVF